jgi:acetyltransferase-like isoleucine patch superfamily enzyme
MRTSRTAADRLGARSLAARLTVNTRPDRSLATIILRKAANWVRSTIYFSLRCRYARRIGLVRIPWSVSIWAPNKVVEFGDRVQFGPRCVVQCDIRFGNDVLIAGDVAFIGRNDHSIDVVGRTIWDSPRGAAQITTIEDDVWVGHGAIVLSGVVIGRGSIVAAGAVVTSDVGRYAVVAGVPAREIRKRFTAEQIQRHEELHQTRSR